MRMILDAVIIIHTNHSLAALYAKHRTTHGWAPSRQSVCQGSCPALSCLSPQVAHTNSTVRLSQLKICRNNKPHLITRALHGCMIYGTLHDVSVSTSEAKYGWLWALLVTVDIAKMSLLSVVHSRSYLLCLQVGLWVAVCACEDMFVCACTCVCVNPGV